MSGGNPFAESVFSSGFPSGGGYYGGYGRASDQEDAYYNFLLEMAKRKEARQYQEQMANQLADNLGPMFGETGGEQGWLARQDLSPDMRNAMEMAAGLVRSRNPMAIESVLNSYNSLQNSMSTDKPADVKMYEYAQQHPDFLSIMKEYRRGTPLVQIGGDGSRPWSIGDVAHPLSPEDKQYLNMSPDQNAYVTNKGEIKPIPTPEKAQVQQNSVFDTFRSVEKDLEDLQTNYPDFNPGDTADAFIRTLGEDDSSVVGKIVAPFQSEPSKQYMNAAKRWVDANRVFLSGAEVPTREFVRDMHVFFGQPTDTPAILQQKKVARLQRAMSIGQATSLSPEDRKAIWLNQVNEQESKLNELRKTSAPATRGAQPQKALNKAAEYARFLKESGMTHSQRLKQEFDMMWEQRNGGE